MKELVVVVVMVATFAASAAAQAPVVPPRDRPAAAPTGTARIRGRVVAADTGAPLRRAQIRVSGPDARANRTVSTDAEGRFDVGDLPAGRHFLTVTRTGYASLQFGQQRPFEPGRPLELANGQLIDRIDFALPRAGVITGRVTDHLGEPVVGVPMQAMRYRYQPGGDRQLVGAGMGGMFGIVTNDLGEFRVSGLMPGTYVLSANPDDGGLRGIARSATSGMETSGDTHGYATTYYPGTLSAEQAEPIDVGVGDVVSVSFALSTARLMRVSGTVRDSQGQPAAGAQLTLGSRTPTSGWTMSGPRIGADGQFSIASVPPGNYFLDVVPRAGIRPTGSPEFDELASVSFTAADRDITGLNITTTQGATVTGRVVFEGTSKAPRPDRVAADGPDHRTSVVYRYGGDNGLIDATGRFRLRGIIGRAIFRTVFTTPGAGGGGWTLKSVTLNGDDITDSPVDIPSMGEISGIEITLIDTPTRLSGTVSNLRREAVKDYVVVIMPGRLREGGWPERFTRTARPNQDGRYEIRGLPAGDFLAVAVAALEDGSEWDPAFRKHVEPIAKHFRLTHGQAATLELELMP